jgi:hypothetical protein
MTPCGAAGPLAGLLACREIPEAAARLACFDRETAALATDTTAADPKQQFGMPEREVAKQEIAAGTRAANPEKIEAHISQLAQTANGRAIFTLDNDQVWRQLVADVDVLAKPGDAVTISRGALGSYWLQTQSKRGCKVTRVR